MCNDGRNDQGISRRRYLNPSWMAATLMDAAFYSVVNFSFLQILGPIGPTPSNF
jgi:hypothetical protein